MAELGDRDRRYIESMIEMQRRLAVLGRVLLLASRNRAAWVAGTAALSAAKILENMEIGHNVMHGQWDWMNDPRIHSSTWDWDTASTAEAWKHSHNFVHHTYTNIRGKDKDLGYEIMRIDPTQKWHPVYLAQPVYNLMLAALFEWGVALHDLDFEAIRKGDKSKAPGEAGAEGDRPARRRARSSRTTSPGRWSAPWPRRRSTRWWRRGGSARQPRGILGRGRRARQSRWAPVVEAALESGAKTFRATAKANATANIVRNVWAYAIIFCGHFPDQTYTFSQKEVEDESRGGWYIRQLTGVGQHRRRPALPHRQRQPQLPGRAPPLPRHAEHPLRRDRPAGARRSASATASPTTAARSASSWGWSSGRFSGSPSPAASPGRSPGPTAPSSHHAPRACDAAYRLRTAFESRPRWDGRCLLLVAAEPRVTATWSVSELPLAFGLAH